MMIMQSVVTQGKKNVKRRPPNIYGNKAST